MPSEEFMQRVLSTGRNDEEIVDEVEEEVEDAPVEEEEETPEAEAPEEESEPVEEPDEQADGEPEEEDGEPRDDDAAEEEGEPAEPVEAQGDDFYLGRYKTREEAEKGWLEKEGMISRQGDEITQLRQQYAEMQGYLQGMQQQPSQPGEFEAWAEMQFEAGNAWGGANEVLDASLRSGDPDYIDSYIEAWKEVDPFEAARFRTMVDNQIADAQRQAYADNQPPPLQDVINQTWLSVAETDPDLRDPEIAKGVGKIMTGEPGLRALAMSGDPQLVRSAIAIARDGYKMQARGPQSGTPRKVRSSDAERVQQDKLDASVTTGDSAPERGNGSTPEVPPELQDMMQRISAGEGGFPKLRE